MWLDHLLSRELSEDFFEQNLFFAEKTKRALECEQGSASDELGETLRNWTRAT